MKFFIGKDKSTGYITIYCNTEHTNCIYVDSNINEFYTPVRGWLAAAEGFLWNCKDCGEEIMDETSTKIWSPLMRLNGLEGVRAGLISLGFEELKHEDK